jgi:predicted Zn-dependent peptidase
MPLLLSDLKPVRKTLSNGLRLVAVPMPHVHRSVVEVQLRIGSRFESREENGISHFLEHMLYRGTPTYPTAHDQALAFESLGGTLVGATAKDFGSLLIAMPPERFLDVLPLLSEVYQEPIFGGIDIERSIVREEILEGLDDAGNLIDANDLIAALAFPDHPLGFPITGLAERLESFDAARLRRHHQRYYAGATTVIAAAGPFDPDAVLTRLEQLFGGIPRGEAVQTPVPPAQTAPSFRFIGHAASQTCLRVGFRAPSFFAPQEAPTQLLVRLMDDGLSTRLYEQICDRRGLCYDVAACYEAYEDVGLLELAAESAHERAAEVLSELLDVVRRLRDDGPSQVELDKAKRRHAWQLSSILDDPSEVASHFALVELNETRQHPAEREAQLAAVTRDQVMSAAREVFRASALNIVAVGTQNKRRQEKLIEIARGL